MSVEVVVALIALAGVLFTGVMSFLGQKHAREVNKAVNCRAAGEPTLYQLAVENHANVVKLDGRVGVVEADVGKLFVRLADHDDWERAEKYPPQS